MFISFCTIGGEESQGVATIESTTETTVAEEEITFEEGVLEFARCMREEGIDFPDPTFDIDGNPEFNELNIENEEAFEEAFTNCEDILRRALPEQFDLDPEVEAALIDASLEFSQCMREEGIDFPDPTFDIDGNPEFNELNIENEEAFEEAFTNCEDILRRALPEQFDLDPEVEAALIDASLEFSQCMREEGIDFPDPTPGEFGFFAFRDADVDWSSEQVQEAFEICQPENPLENLDD